MANRTGTVEPKPKQTRQKPAAKGRLLVVANRLPVHRVRTPEGQIWKVSPGGLVAALKPILEERGGAWIGWGGDGARRQPFTHENLNLHPVPITRDELESYYAGLSNRSIWPLYHDVIRTPEFRRRWWGPYVEVNQRFSQAVCRIAEEGDTVWVHDYHLQLVPAMIRQERPDLRIGFFFHIPFPPEELFARLPWRQPITEGLLGADVVGFQTALGARNFANVARRFAGAEIHGDILKVGDRSVRVGAFPISIDTAKFKRIANMPETVDAAAKLRERLGERKIFLGVDRLDYTKGIDIRLKAFEELLKRGRHSAADCTLVQVAVPSREQVEDYARMRRTIEELVGRINGEYAEPGRVAVNYLRRTLPMDELVTYYKAADVMMVTPLRDGMNLVAKEYAASHGPSRGALVLSEFAGAAHELRDAIVVNPYDIDGLASAMEEALELDEKEASQRMAAMADHVETHDVYAWADMFLRAVAA